MTLGSEVVRHLHTELYTVWEARDSKRVSYIAWSNRLIELIDNEYLQTVVYRVQGQIVSGILYVQSDSIHYGEVLEIVAMISKDSNGFKTCFNNLLDQARTLGIKYYCYSKYLESDKYLMRYKEV